MVVANQQSFIIIFIVTIVLLSSWPSQPGGTGGDGGGADKAKGRRKGHTRNPSGLILVFSCPSYNYDGDDDHCCFHYMMIAMDLSIDDNLDYMLPSRGCTMYIILFACVTFQTIVCFLNS